MEDTSELFCGIGQTSFEVFLFYYKCTCFQKNINVRTDLGSKLLLLFLDVLLCIPESVSVEQLFASQYSSLVVDKEKKEAADLTE